MPLVALKDGERVCTLEFKTPAELRAAVPPGSARCPDCSGEFVLKTGYVLVPHFAHKPGANCSPLEAKGESVAHLEGKRIVREFLLAERADPGARVELEYRFPQFGRIADVCLVQPGGHMEVHEVQLASITRAEIDARTTDYERAGVGAVIWWLGPTNLRGDAKAWVLERCGQVGELEIEAVAPLAARAGLAA